MDIASLSMALSQQNVLSNAGIAMLGKSMDLVEEQSAQLFEMMGNATPALETMAGIGTQFDASI